MIKTACGPQIFATVKPFFTSKTEMPKKCNFSNSLNYYRMCLNGDKNNVFSSNEYFFLEM